MASSISVNPYLSSYPSSVASPGLSVPSSSAPTQSQVAPDSFVTQSAGLPASAAGLGPQSLANLQQLGGFSAAPSPATAAVPSLLSQDAFQSADPVTEAAPPPQPTPGQIFTSGAKMMAHSVVGPLAIMGALRRERYFQLTTEKMPVGFGRLGEVVAQQGKWLNTALKNSRFGKPAPAGLKNGYGLLRDRIGYNAASKLIKSKVDVPKSLIKETDVAGEKITKIDRRIRWAEKDLEKLDGRPPSARVARSIIAKKKEIKGLQELKIGATTLLNKEIGQRADALTVKRVADAAKAAPKFGATRQLFKGVHETGGQVSGTIGKGLGRAFRPLGHLHVGRFFKAPFKFIGSRKTLVTTFSGIGKKLGQYSGAFALYNGYTDAKRAWALFQDPKASLLRKFFAVAAVGGDIAGAAALNPEFAPMIAVLGDGVAFGAGYLRDMSTKTTPSPTGA